MKEVITEEKDVFEKFKDHFEKIVETLQIGSPVLSDKSFHHASVLKTKDVRGNSGWFSFKLVTIEDICKKILALDTSKATQSDDMPTKIFKNNSDMFSKFFQVNLNDTIETRTFPEQLKYAGMKPVFKKDLRNEIYEKCLNKQLEEYFQALLSKYQCGFRKGYSIINALHPMIEKWRKYLDEGGAIGVLLTDLPKTSACLPHELLIAKLHAYGIDIPSFKLLHSY